MALRERNFAPLRRSTIRRVSTRFPSFRIMKRTK
jgi:hypothetical protein